MNIYLLGHINPDLDTIASPYVYAELLKALNKYPNYNIIPLLTGSPNKETEFAFSSFGVNVSEYLNANEIQTTESDKFILLDHNEENQRHQVVGKIIEIIDHHKLNFNYPEPIEVYIKPYGSTASVLYELYKFYKVEPSQKSKGLMLAALISDTQGLKSSTTTNFDKNMAQDLATQLNLDLNQFIYNLFKHKSDLSGLTPKEIVNKDSKVFDFGGKKVFISQVEVVNPQEIISQKETYKQTLEEIKKENNLDYALFVITDILNMTSQALAPSENDQILASKAFNEQVVGGVIDLKNRTSRKKDIVPPIENVINQL